MTAKKIIAEIYESTDLNSCINSRKKPVWFPGSRQDWQDELKAEAFKIICEQPAELIERLYFERRLNFFIGKIIVNLARQERNSLQKPYMKSPAIDPTGLPIVEEVNRIDFDFAEVTKRLDELKQKDHIGYYYANILELYGQLGSVRAVSAKTTIPVMSVWQAIRNGRKMIKQLLNED